MKKSFKGKNRKRALVVTLILTILFVGFVILSLNRIVNIDPFVDYIRSEISYIFERYDKNVGQGELEIHIIDVGQGDAILLRTQSSVLLVDSGTTDSGVFLRRYLRANGVKKIDFFVSTHAHEDHIGGAETIVKSFPIGKIMLDIDTSDSPILERFLKEALSHEIDIISPEYGSHYEIGDISFRVLAPKSDYEYDSNDNSLVLRVVWGETSFMLTGDAEAASEAEIISDFSKEELESTILKLGHHGSNTSTTEEFLAAVSPEWVVISCGRSNSFGHPHSEVISRLYKYGLTDENIRRTDLDGSIKFISDGKAVKIIE